MEDLLLSEQFDRYEAFLTCVKRWLMNWKAELARHILPCLSSMPAVLGATLGVEAGNLVRMTMNERDEYVGRALNIACRLQDAVKDKAPHSDCYKALVSARLYNERLEKASAKYKVESTTCSLRNILGGSGFECRKIDFTMSAAGQRLPWPAPETARWTCARSNWEASP